MQQGKMKISSIVFFLILGVAGMLTFKYAASRIDQKLIKKEIFDEMGVFRGSKLTEAKIEAIITKALSKRSLEPLDMVVEIKRGIINFYYQYEFTVDYILFKRTEIVEVEDEMENYGG